MLPGHWTEFADTVLPSLEMVPASESTFPMGEAREASLESFSPAEFNQSIPALRRNTPWTRHDTLAGRGNRRPRPTLNPPLMWLTRVRFRVFRGSDGTGFQNSPELPSEEPRLPILIRGRLCAFSSVRRWILYSDRSSSKTVTSTPKGLLFLGPSKVI